MHTATYCPEDNKLRLYPASRLDKETYNRVKAAGFKWAPKQEIFVAPAWSCQREDLLLDLCEYIGDEDYSPEERAADRAERFAGYQEKRFGEAVDAADTFEAGPAAFGHQNAARAQRQADRHDRSRRHAINQWGKAEYWQQRTAGVIAHALHKSSPEVRRSRLVRLEAEQRKHAASVEKARKVWDAVQKCLTLDGLDDRLEMVVREEQLQKASPALKLIYSIANGHCHCFDYQHPRNPDRKTSLYSLLTDPVDPITAREAVSLWLDGAADPYDTDSYAARWSSHYALRISYETAMLANEGGIVGELNIEVGGWIDTSANYRWEHLIAIDGWSQIIRVHRSPKTKRVTSVTCLGRDRWGYNDPEEREKIREITIDIERMGHEAYRAPTDDERAKFATAEKARKKAKAEAKPKAPPTINPTMEEARKLQQIWNEAAAASANRSRSTIPQPSEIVAITQAQYSANSKGTYARCEIVEVTEKLVRTDRRGAGRVGCFRVRVTSGAGFYGADRVIVLTDKPQTAIPWESVADMADKMPTVESVLKTLPEFAEKCRGYAWYKDEEFKQMLADAIYVGYAYQQSQTQCGLTEAGADALKKLKTGVA